MKLATIWSALTFLATPLLIPAAASATEECESLCSSVDDVEEACEALYGDAAAMCSSIAAVDDTCDPEDGGTSETCDGLCADVVGLSDECEATLGASDPVCEALDPLAQDCQDGSYDGPAGDGNLGDDEDENEKDDAKDDSDGDCEDGDDEGDDAEDDAEDDAADCGAVAAGDSTPASCSVGGGSTATGLLAALLLGFAPALVRRQPR